MKIYSCETHINHALDVFVAEARKISNHGSCTGRTKSYPQIVPTVKRLHYMLWRTNSRTQYVDKYCGYVYKFVDNLFVNRM